MKTIGNFGRFKQPKQISLRKRFIDIALLLCLFALLPFYCANPIIPKGGPKDVSPPEVTECIPENYSTQFDSKEIRITFNEFVNLKSSGSEIFISPPISNPPDYKLRGKSVVIKLDDTLSPNTTYIITFGTSITDITEGNSLSNFRYVFSTGTYVDSLMITGQVINAFDNQPQADVYALLYTDSSDTIPFDSLPYKGKPIYIAMTNEQGRFILSNLRYDAYKLFVLSDKSGDFQYNMPAEKIAFSDSLIYPWIGPKTTIDSLGTDSIQPQDTILSASIELSMFEEIDSTQDVKKSDLVKNDEFMIVFAFPPRDPVITPLNIDSTQVWWMEEYSLNKDTVILWTVAEIPDTLTLKISDEGTILDTVIISPTKIIPRKKQKKEEEKPVFLTLSWQPRGGTINHFKYPISGIFSYPIAEYDLSRIRLFTERDTVDLPIEFTDSLQRKFHIDYPWKEAKSYKIFIPDSSFISYTGLSHDTLVYSFQTANSRDLASLLVNVDISSNPGDYIIQLQSEKGKTLEEQYLNESGQIIFAFIQPGKYKLKAILDLNKNTYWDTGDYIKKIQPEKVFFFSKTIELRGNWDVEEDWSI